MRQQDAVLLVFLPEFQFHAEKKSRGIEEYSFQSSFHGPEHYGYHGSRGMALVGCTFSIYSITLLTQLKQKQRR